MRGGQRGRRGATAPEASLRRRILLRRGAAFQILDLFRHARQEIRKHALLQDVAGELAARELVADDFHRRAKHLIAAGVVIVEVRVHEETHGLVGERLQFLQQHPRGLRRDMRVDDQHIVLIDDNRGVRADVRRPRADGAVDPRRDLRELVRRLWRGRLRVEDETADAEQHDQQRESSAIHGPQYASGD